MAAIHEPPTVRLRIRGMHCAGCVSMVEQALAAAGDVQRAVVNLATETADVTLRSGPAGADATERLAAAVRRAGYEAIPLDSEDDGGVRSEARRVELRIEARRLALAALLGSPILASHLVPHAWSMAAGLHSPTGWIVQALLALAVVLIAAGRMFTGATRAALAGSLGMDALVALAVGASFIAGMVGIALRRGELVMFDSAALIVLFVAFGKHLEARARGRTSGALEALAMRIPRTAILVRDAAAERVEIASVLPGDVLRVVAGSVVPVDGEIVSGQLTLDESMLTGEPLPVERGVGHSVFGGTTAQDGGADIRASATGAKSAAARIARLVESAQAGKTPWQRLADRVAAVFVPVVIALSLLTFAGWSLAGAPAIDALTRALAVLVVACPCAMGLAIPMAVLVATTRAASRGLLVRDAAALEAAAALDLVVFDKTGTLTLGRPVVRRIEPRGQLDEAEILRLAAAVERHLQHPLAHAIVRAAQERGVALPETSELVSKAGSGAKGRVEGRAVLVGNERWLSANGVPVNADSGGAGSGATLVYVAVDGALSGVIELSDAVHPQSQQAIARLHRLGLRTAVLSGDNPVAARRLAEQLGIDVAEGGLTPGDKLDRIREHVAQSRRVAMVGDGVNDAPALAAATVGIAIGAGADVARETAAICLVGHNPLLVADAIELARRSVRTMRQNLGWAFGYNLAMLPVAALAPVPPAFAATAMMLSSLSVVGNSLRLGWRRDRGI